MRGIDVKEQVRLSLAKCIELVLSGIRFRLFRAAITVVIISLAAAFLMAMLGESIVSRQVASVIDRQTQPRDAFLFWANRIANPMTRPELTSLLATAEPGDPRWRELAGWGKLDDAQMQSLHDVAARQEEYLNYIQGLDPGERRPLVGSARGSEILQNLQAPDERQRFAAELVNVSRPIPGGFEQFSKFLDDWQQTVPLRQRLLDRHAKLVADLRPRVEKSSAKALLAEGGEELREHLESLGFVISPEQFQAVAHQAALASDSEKLEPLLRITRFRKALKDRAGGADQELDYPALVQAVASQSGSQWLAQTVKGLSKESEDLAQKRQQARDLDARIRDLRRADPADPQITALETERSKLQLSSQDQNLIAPASQKALAAMTLEPQRIQDVADYELTQRGLAEVENILAGATGTEKGFLGFSVRAMWLLVVSFVVCVVGIANAMLMSVTERFREIATMKCLGATDGFIMVNFILESIMQGVAGGVIGTLLGLLLGTLRGWARYGSVAMSHFPLGDMAMAAVISLLVGMLVSAMAAVYPAWVAARLAPMEAMRIE